MNKTPESFDEWDPGYIEFAKQITRDAWNSGYTAGRGSREAEDAKVRAYLWLNHGCPHSALYGDDGEMQCAKCLTDFKRRGLLELTCAMGANLASRDAEVQGRTQKRDAAEDALVEIREHVKALRDALVYVKARIESSEQWWMDCPDRGGFDVDQIDAALALTEAQEKP